MNWKGGAVRALLLLLGFVRVNLLVLRDLLYGFEALHVMLGRAPLIASIIWTDSGLGRSGNGGRRGISSAPWPCSSSPWPASMPSIT